MSFWPNNCAQLTTKGRHTARWSLVNLIFCCETSIVGFLKVFFFCFLPFTSNPLPSLPVGFPSYHRWVSLKSLVPVVISYHQQPLSLVSLPCHDIAQKKTLLASASLYQLEVSELSSLELLKSKDCKEKRLSSICWAERWAGSPPLFPSDPFPLSQDKSHPRALPALDYLLGAENFSLQRVIPD